MVDKEKLKKSLLEIKGSLKKLEEKKDLSLEKDSQMYNQIYKRLGMYVRRIYPNYKEVMGDFFPKKEVSTLNQLRELFKPSIQDTMSVIDIILEEIETWDIEDFTPIKPKEETEWQLGSNKLGYFKKKKTK